MDAGFASCSLDVNGVFEPREFVQAIGYVLGNGAWEEDWGLGDKCDVVAETGYVAGEDGGPGKS